MEPQDLVVGAEGSGAPRRARPREEIMSAAAAYIILKRRNFHGEVTTLGCLFDALLLVVIIIGGIILLIWR